MTWRSSTSFACGRREDGGFYKQWWCLDTCLLATEAAVNWNLALVAWKGLQWSSMVFNILQHLQSMLKLSTSSWLVHQVHTLLSFNACFLLHTNHKHARQSVVSLPSHLSFPQLDLGVLKNICAKRLLNLLQKQQSVVLTSLQELSCLPKHYSESGSLTCESGIAR